MIHSHWLHCWSAGRFNICGQNCQNLSGIFTFFNIIKSPTQIHKTCTQIAIIGVQAYLIFPKIVKKCRYFSRTSFLPSLYLYCNFYLTIKIYYYLETCRLICLLMRVSPNNLWANFVPFCYGDLNIRPFQAPAMVI